MQINSRGFASPQGADKRQVDGQVKQLVLLDAVEHLINAPGIPGSPLDRFFRGRGDLGDFADVVPLLCRLKAGGQDRKALLHGTGGQRWNILRALSVALGSTAGLPAQRVQKVVNILCRNAAHHLITKVR